MLVLAIGCTPHGGAVEVAKQDSTTAVASAVKGYAPGLGEFMMSMQMHHAKLYYAGKEKNWPLAAFETKEIGEIVGDIKDFCSDRPELKELPVLLPQIDSLTLAIDAKNRSRFFERFNLMTASCNTCHQATQHGFIHITLPTAPPVNNQDFSFEGGR